MKSWEQFKELQLDVLKEIGNIGAGNAATALSQLLQKTIDMKVPNVKILSFDDITDYVGGAEQVVVTVFLKIEGEISGNMFFILQEGAAKRLLSSLIGDTGEEGLTEIEFSAARNR